MGEFLTPRRVFQALLPVALVLVIASAITGAVYFSDETRSLRSEPQVVESSASSITGFFASRFPANTEFEKELDGLRQTGALKPENEALILRTIGSTSRHLQMPSAILWCLLFQESRLNHLEGLDEDHGAQGLGQFSYFSFYEINHHLGRYSQDNVTLMFKLFGQDIRPVEPLRHRLNATNSYFSIPTAVTASAAFLNNRYVQLGRILEKKGEEYDPELLWLYAAMAYNKGTRSVLAFWNESRREAGNREVKRLLTDKTAAFKSMTDGRRLTRSLHRIWPAHEAGFFAREWRVHMQNLSACSTRTFAEGKF